MPTSGFYFLGTHVKEFCHLLWVNSRPHPGIGPLLFGGGGRSICDRGGLLGGVIPALEDFREEGHPVQ